MAFHWIWVLLWMEAMKSTKSEEKCTQRCSIKSKRNMPCTLTQLGKECIVPASKVHLFSPKDGHLAPLPNLIKPSNARIKEEFSTNVKIVWRLTRAKDIIYTKGFLLELRLFYRSRKERREYLLFEPKRNLSSRHKRSRFVVTCLNIQDVHYLGIQIWSLPNKNIVVSNHTLSDDGPIDCFSLLDRKQGIWKQFLIEKPSTTRTPSRTECTCLPLETLQIWNTRQDMHINACPLKPNIEVVVQLLKNGVIVWENWISQTMCNVTLRRENSGNYTITVKRRCGITREIVCHKRQITNLNEVGHLEIRHQNEVVIAVIIGSIVGIVCVVVFVFVSLKRRLRETKTARNVHSSGLNNENSPANHLLRTMKRTSVLLIPQTIYTGNTNHENAIFYFAEILKENSFNVDNIYDHVVSMMKNKPDWLEEHVSHCDLIMFIPTPDLCNNPIASNSNSAKNGNSVLVSELMPYILTLIRNTGKPCHIVSFGYNQIRNQHTTRRRQFFLDFCNSYKYINRLNIVDITFLGGRLKDVTLDLESLSAFLTNVEGPENINLNDFSSINCQSFLTCIQNMVMHSFMGAQT